MINDREIFANPYQGMDNVRPHTDTCRVVNTARCGGGGWGTSPVGHYSIMLKMYMSETSDVG